MRINKNIIKNFFIGLVWVAVGAGCITLLVSGVYSKDAKRCKGVQIDISGVSNNFFIDKNDVYAIIKNFGGDSTAKKTLASIDLKKIENELEKDVWIKNAELFFDNNDYLKVSVEEREPIARVFTVNGNTFYIDSSCMMLPLSEKFSARVPVFTGFTSDAKILSKTDSSLLYNIRNISIKIAVDSFLMAMIDQVDITVNRGFEMTPKFGKQLIVFGDAADIDAKFSKLKLFYKDVIAQAGWNRYRSIDLQYKDQVVAGIRGKEDVIADSLKTLELIKMIAENAAKGSADSTQLFAQEPEKNSDDSSMIRQSIQRDEEGIEPADNVQSISLPSPAVTKPIVVTKPTNVVTQKPAIPEKPKQKVIPAKPPVKKAVMQKPVIQKPKLKPDKRSNDY